MIRLRKQVITTLIAFVFLIEVILPRGSYVYSSMLYRAYSLRPMATSYLPESIFKPATERANEGMRPILVLNCGSSSIKYKLIDIRTEEVIGGYEGKVEVTADAEGKRDYSTPIGSILESLPAEPIAIGHRVVHGADKFSGSVLITDKVVAALEECSKLAPLHNPANLAGIRVCKELRPDIPQMGVFDTAFHQSMPDVAFRYALPDELYKKHRIRRYGFHGTSHRYVSNKAAERMRNEKPRHRIKIVTVHLGNGCSIAAVRGGRSVDTSMGLTPLEGLVMGTRPGDIDPGVIIHMMRELGLSADELDGMLNKESGLLGISGISNDVRELLEAEAEGNRMAHLALEIFIYRVLKYVYAYDGILNGADAIVFTGGIGETDNVLKNRIIGRLRRHFRDNRKVGRRPHIYTIPTNEELVIARDTDEILSAIESAHTKHPVMEEVTLPKNPYRKGKVTLAGLDAIDHLIIPTTIPTPEKETKKIRRIINSLAMGYIETSRTYEQQHGKKPLIAALSYNTLNPEKIRPQERQNANVYIVDRAIEIAKAFGVQFYGAGSLQFDAALIKRIARNKIGARYVKGRPDVFAFSSLHAYDIAMGMLLGFPEVFKSSVFKPEPFDEEALQETENFLPEDPLARKMFERARQERPDDLPIIVLPEGNSKDVLIAGRIAHKQGLARIVFMYKEKIDPATVTNPDRLIDVEQEIDRERVVEPEDIREFFARHPEAPIFVEEKRSEKFKVVVKPKLFLKYDLVDGMVSGINSPTSAVINMAMFLKGKMKAETDTFGVYDFCPLRLPTNDYGAEGLVFLLNIVALTASSAKEVAEMVPMAASDFEGITGVKPKIALLIGPGKKPKKMFEAYKILRKSHGGLDLRVCDMSTAVKEGCNIFVPPDLATGNIAYKLFERVLNAKVWGLDIMAMGKNKPVDISDLSRGADIEQILYSILLVSLRISGRSSMKDGADADDAAVLLERMPISTGRAEAGEQSHFVPAVFSAIASAA